MAMRLEVFVAACLCVPALAGAQERVFFGNLHSHTSYSDGSGTPTQAYEHARDEAHLDFLAITEHNHRQADGDGDRHDGLLIATNPTLYVGPQPEALIPTARRLTEDGRFVALYGQEFSSIGAGNHVNVFDVGTVIDVPNGEFGRLVEWLEAHPDSQGRPPLVQLNHPAIFDDSLKEYGADDFGSIASWVATLGRFAALIEILNGPALERTIGHRPAEVMQADFLQYLNLGFHVAPTGDQDNHYQTWGTITDARTAVIAPALTKAAILDALRARHVYATEDRNLELVAKVNGQLMGSIITPPPAGSALDITLSIRDVDEPAAAYSIEVFADAAPGSAPASVVEAFTLQGDSPLGQPYRLDGLRFQGPGQYLFLKARQFGEHSEDDDRAWTAPVWFESGAAPLGPPSPQVRIVALLPNPAGDERQNEEITLENAGTSTVSLAGWLVRDEAGKTWSLSSLTSLAPGAKKTIRRNGQPMSMNNGGDTIALVDATGAILQSVSYPAVADGQRFVPSQ